MNAKISLFHITLMLIFIIVTPVDVLGEKKPPELNNDHSSSRHSFKLPELQIDVIALDLYDNKKINNLTADSYVKTNIKLTNSNDSNEIDIRKISITARINKNLFKFDKLMDATHKNERNNISHYLGIDGYDYLTITLEELPLGRSETFNYSTYVLNNIEDKSSPLLEIRRIEFHPSWGTKSNPHINIDKINIINNQNALSPLLELEILKEEILYNDVPLDVPLAGQTNQTSLLAEIKNISFILAILMTLVVWFNKSHNIIKNRIIKCDFLLKLCDSRIFRNKNIFNCNMYLLYSFISVAFIHTRFNININYLQLALFFSFFLIFIIMYFNSEREFGFIWYIFQVAALIYVYFIYSFNSIHEIAYIPLYIPLSSILILIRPLVGVDQNLKTNYIYLIAIYILFISIYIFGTDFLNSFKSETSKLLVGPILFIGTTLMFLLFNFYLASSDSSNAATSSDPSNAATSSDPSNAATSSDPSNAATSSDPSNAATSSDPSNAATSSDPSNAATSSDPSNVVASSDPSNVTTSSDPSNVTTSSDPSNIAVSSDPSRIQSRQI